MKEPFNLKVIKLPKRKHCFQSQSKCDVSSVTVSSSLWTSQSNRGIQLHYNATFHNYNYGKLQQLLFTVAVKNELLPEHSTGTPGRITRAYTSPLWLGFMFLLLNERNAHRDDLRWRLRVFGLQFLIFPNFSPQIHLDHKGNWKADITFRLNLNAFNLKFTGWSFHPVRYRPAGLLISFAPKKWIKLVSRTSIKERPSY